MRYVRISPDAHEAPALFVALVALTMFALLATALSRGPALPWEGHPFAPRVQAQGLTESPGALSGPAPTSSVAERQAKAKLPVSFIPNEGQIDKRVAYYSQGSDHAFYFTPDKAVLSFREGKRGVALHLTPLGARPPPELDATHRAAGRVNYLVGSERHTSLATYRELTYRDLWPGIDLVFRGRGSVLKYELHVAAGADPSKIQLAYRGADRLSVGPAGNLLVQTPIGTLRDSRPVSYQRIGGKRVPVDSRYALAGGTAYGFALGSSYDSRRPLVIDPGLVYSTYLGGSDNDAATAIAVDGSGSAYVTGNAYSTDFPTTPGSFDTDGAHEIFVTKLNAAGSGLVYSTHLGGSSSDASYGIAVDGSGRAYVTGMTCSPDFPISVGAFQTGSTGCGAFATRLNAAGSGLSYSTYLGNYGQANDIAVDASGNAYVTGYSCCDFPTTLGSFQTSSADSTDVFVSKLNSSGSSLVYSTFVGGNGGDLGYGVAVDAGGGAYVTGSTVSANFPTTAGAFDTSFNGPYSDAFVVKLNAAGSGPTYSTYLGGSSYVPGYYEGGDQGSAVAVDTGGNAYVTGATLSPGFPTTPGVFDTVLDGTSDVFVTKVNPTGSALGYSTYLGGDSSDFGMGIAADGNGEAYVTGRTAGYNASVVFPTTEGAFDRTFNGGSNFFGDGGDAFFSKVDTTGSALAYSTYLGSNEDDAGAGIDIDAGGHAYVAGSVRGAEFPNTAGAYDRSHNGGLFDGFVTKLDPGETTTGRIRVLLDAQPDGPQDFGFTAGGGLSPASFALDDDSDNTLSNTESFDNLAPGSSYSIAASPAPEGWSLTSATCNDGSPVSGIDVSAGETVVCIFKYGRPMTGSKIVFASDRDGNREIYTMDPDGDPQLRITTNTWKDERPEWSPDGSKIVYVSYENGNGDIFTMDANGGNRTPLTTDPGVDTDPTWSPDGTKIAFTARRDYGSNGKLDAEIYTMNANGTDQTRRTVRPSTSDERASWSPDGTKIAFGSDPPGPENGDIYTIAPNGSGLKRLTTFFDVDTEPAWSPDGSKIAFRRDVDGADGPVFRLYTMLANGKNPKRLTSNSVPDAFEPAWSPDGSQVVYFLKGRTKTDVYVVNSNGTNPSKPRLTTTAGFDGYPSWRQVSAITSTGKLEVQKKLFPTTDPGRFALRIDGATEVANAGDGDTTGEQTVSATTHLVDEVGSTITGTSLSDYGAAIECRDQDGSGNVVASTEQAGQLYVPVPAGADVVCTVTNVRSAGAAPGSLEVRKVLSPVEDPGRFDLQIDGATLVFDAGDGGTTGAQIVSAGTHSVGEVGSETIGTSLDDYSSTIECEDQGGGGQVVAGTDDSGPLNVPIVGGADVVCNVTNARHPATGTLAVTKNLLPAGDPGRFDLEVDSSIAKRDAGDDDTTGPLTVAAGAHTVRERSGTATELDDYTTSTTCRDDATGALVATGSDVTGVTVNDDQHVSCTITNTRKQAPPENAAGNLYDVAGGIDCLGDDGRSNRPLRGTVTATRSGNTLTIQVDYQGGDPDTTFSIELFEAGSSCSPDNNGDTGTTLTSNASGDGTATFDIPYPFPTYTGDSLGDGLGSDAFVLVLDNTLSTGAGDRASTREIALGNTGKLEVRKELSPPTDSGRFDLAIDGVTQEADAGAGDTTGETTVSAGTHTVGETGSFSLGTNLSDYTSAIECVDRDGSGETVASASGAGPLYVPVATGTDVVCTITNSRHVELEPISTDFNSPVGIDYHEPSNKVAVSVNYSSGEPHNFELIDGDGSHEQFSAAHGFGDEVKIGTVRSSSCQGGFTPGELLTGTGAPGVIARISPDGSTVQDPWVTLPGETGLMRGGLFQDRYCVFGGDLIAVTTTGGVWRVTSTGAATEIAQLGTHLEGVTTLPDDADRYGPWAGTMLIGAESSGTIYSVAPDGTTESYQLGIAPEDIDVVPANENFFGVSYAEGRIVGAPAAQFADKVGDVVVAQENPGILWDVQWRSDAQEFETTPIAQVPQWEHVTFAPAGICEVPHVSSGAPLACDGTATTNEDTPVEISLVASDREQDPLTYSIVDPPEHGSLGPITGNAVTYTPAHDYSGPDSFTFKANDGSSDSNAAQVSITINPVDDGTIVAEKAGTPDDPQDFSFTTGGGLAPASFELDDDGDTENELSNRRTFADVPPGSGYAVAESLPSGWDQVSATCDDGSSVSDIGVSDGETVTCTFTNQKRGEIVVEKDAQPNDPQDFDFSFTPPGGSATTFQLDDDTDPTLSSSRTFGDLEPSSGYSVAETAVPAGWDAYTTCSGGNPPTNITVGPGQRVTCTITNKRRGTVVIRKDAFPDETDDFNFTAAGGLTPTSFQLDDDPTNATLPNTRTFANVIAKNGYTVTEGPTTDFAVGVRCDDDSSATPSVGNLPARGATINVDPAETVTCTFVNTGVYPRPGGGSPARVPLIPAFKACTAPNRTHVAPLNNPSCTPHGLESGQLKTSSVGTGQGNVRVDAVRGNLTVPGDQADVTIKVDLTDVRRQSDDADYPGKVVLATDLRITDRSNYPPAFEGSGTAFDTELSAPIDCVPTSGTIGSRCQLETSMDSLVLGYTTEEHRTVISMLRLAIEDAGPDGSITPPTGSCPPTCGNGDEKTFMHQGVFTP